MENSCGINLYTIQRNKLCFYLFIFFFCLRLNWDKLFREEFRRQTPYTTLHTLDLHTCIALIVTHCGLPLLILCAICSIVWTIELVWSATLPETFKLWIVKSQTLRGKLYSQCYPILLTDSGCTQWHNQVWNATLHNLHCILYILYCHTL